MEGRLNDITWKFTASEEYSVASGYKDQFEGLLFSIMPVLIWKKVGTPKVQVVCLAYPSRQGLDLEPSPMV
jgi:hypothetical protein